MYYYLNGKLSMLQSDLAVIDCGGVGYLVNISTATYEKLTAHVYTDPSGELTEAPVKLFTHYCVKEDSADLFGFYTLDERDAFRLLISVSGVGPRSALSVLSTLSVSQLALAVECDDARAIASSNGIGQKTAQKIILELKGKLNADSSYGYEQKKQVQSTEKDIIKEAISALKALGFSASEAQKAVNSCKDAQSLEELITRSLAALNKL